MSLLDKAIKKIEESKIQAETQKDEKPVKIEDLKPPKPPKQVKKIVGDKELNKKQMIDWFIDLFKDKGNIFTLDYLRGQRQSFEAVYEMRKEK